MSPSANILLTRSDYALIEVRMRVQEGLVIIERTRALAAKFRRVSSEMEEAVRLARLSRSMGLDVDSGGAQAAVVPADGVTAENEVEPAPASGSCVDVEMLEDREMMAALNARGFDCDKCGGDEPLVAVARFLNAPIAIGLCGDCYRGLKAMSRGEVV